MNDQDKIATKFGIHKSLLEAVMSVTSPLNEDLTMITHDGEQQHVIKGVAHNEKSAASARDSVHSAAAKHAKTTSDKLKKFHSDAEDNGEVHHQLSDDKRKHDSSKVGKPEKHSSGFEVHHHNSIADYAKHHAKMDAQHYKDNKDMYSESAGSRPQDKTAGESNPVMQGSSGEHKCAKQIAHEEYGVGKPIFGQHAEPDRYGNVAWYDVMFDHGVEERLPVTEMKVIDEMNHGDHKKKK